MLHPSLAERYVSERRTYGRLLRLAFAMAGIYWIVIYCLPLDTHVQLRSGQTFIYFVLLTLWGLDYMREQRRLTIVIQQANANGIPPESVSLSDVEQRASLFTMMTPRGGGWGMIMPVFFVVGMVVGWVLIIGQYMRAINVMLQ
ncbi:MAG: hypothetical protein FGM24_02300 [Candidatus Kapabacteria bacterium]|nr:hypothetical protein [Candidatus Kapabacteria bacterium]